MTRRLPPPRRPCERLNFENDGHRYNAAISRFEDGDVAEIFITSGKPGSGLEAVVRDAAILASIALQFGASADELRHALTRLDNGEPAGPLGAVLDLLGKETG